LEGRLITRGRQPAQALVEFGLVVMLFVLLLSGVFDFGMLLNTRLGVSAMSRELARAAASGATTDQLNALASQQDHIVGITTAPFGGNYFSLNGTPPRAGVAATETFWTSTGAQAASAQAAGSGGSVRVEVVAQGAEVITPLIRPLFGCANGGQQHCLVPISAGTTMRLEPNAVATPGP
jgi:Flp pilus assembly protein TadG